MVRRDPLAEVRDRLEEERASLIDQIDALSVENQNQQDDYGVGNHLADDASEVFIRERNIALSNNAQELLSQVDAALHRLAEGNYGLCGRCGQPIALDRLEALPYASHCITCQSELEHTR